MVLRLSGLLAGIMLMFPFSVRASAVDADKERAGILGSDYIDVSVGRIERKEAYIRNDLTSANTGLAVGSHFELGAGYCRSVAHPDFQIVAATWSLFGGTSPPSPVLRIRSESEQVSASVAYFMRLRHMTPYFSLSAARIEIVHRRRLAIPGSTSTIGNSANTFPPNNGDPAGVAPSSQVPILLGPILPAATAGVDIESTDRTKFDACSGSLGIEIPLGRLSVTPSITYTKPLNQPPPTGTRDTVFNDAATSAWAYALEANMWIVRHVGGFVYVGASNAASDSHYFWTYGSGLRIRL